MSNKNELATQNSESYMILRDFNLGDMIAEELDGLNASFESIKIPSGGGVTFDMPGENPDEPESVRAFSAVILLQHPLNSFYASEYQGGSNPPDCGSYDGIFGTGTPGGSCKTCPYNAFGSGKNGGKACKNRRRLYVLPEGEIFPMILTLPTGSLKGFTRYLMRILPKFKASNAVVTRFTLKRATSGSGMVYSQAQFALDRVLSSEEYALIRKLTEQVKQLSASIGYDAEDPAPLNVDPETGAVIEPLK